MSNLGSIIAFAVGLVLICSALLLWRFGRELKDHGSLEVTLESEGEETLGRGELRLTEIKSLSVSSKGSLLSKAGIGRQAKQEQPAIGLRSKEKICPFCSNRFHPGDCAVVSSIDPHEILLAPPKGGIRRLFARIWVRRLVGARYVTRLARRQCPHCSNLLPADIEIADIYIIPVIGAIGSGKSTFLAAVIEELRREGRGPIGGIQFVGLTESSESLYRRDYYLPLFREQKVLPATSLASPQEIQHPLICEFRIWEKSNQAGKRIYISFYDVSGEDISNEASLVQQSRFVLNASAILFLVDPMKMPWVAARLPFHLRSPKAEVSQQTDILWHIAATYCAYHNVEQVNIPIAVTLSKSDVLRYVGREFNVYKSFHAPHLTDEVRVKELLEIDSEIQSYLGSYYPTFLSLSRTFPKAGYFAVSATGFPPDEKGNYPALSPVRCLDPLFWILWQLGLLKSESLGEDL